MPSNSCYGFLFLSQFKFRAADYNNQCGWKTPQKKLRLVVALMKIDFCFYCKHRCVIHVNCATVNRFVFFFARIYEES